MQWGLGAAFACLYKHIPVGFITCMAVVHSTTSWQFLALALPSPLTVFEREMTYLQAQQRVSTLPCTSKEEGQWAEHVQGPATGRQRCTELEHVALHNHSTQSCMSADTPDTSDHPGAS